MHPCLLKRFQQPFLTRVISNVAKVVLSAVDFFMLKASGESIEVNNIEQFTDEYTSFSKDFTNKVGITTYKSKAYLNWKYAQRPYRRETMLEVRSGGRIVGYLVIGISPYRKKERLGVILEIICDPDDDTKVLILLKEAVRYLRAENSDRIACVMTDTRIASALQKLMFRRTTGDTSVMFGNLASVDIDSETLVDVNEWYFTFGESDAYMLSS